MSMRARAHVCVRVRVRVRVRVCVCVLVRAPISIFLRISCNLFGAPTHLPLHVYCLAPSLALASSPHSFVPPSPCPAVGPSVSPRGGQQSQGGPDLPTELPQAHQLVLSPRAHSEHRQHRVAHRWAEHCGVGGCTYWLPVLILEGCPGGDRVSLACPGCYFRMFVKQEIEVVFLNVQFVCTRWMAASVSHYVLFCPLPFCSGS